MVCKSLQAQLDTYLDNELPAEEMKQFDAHVRNCASCSAEGLARLQMKRRVRAAGQSFAPSEAFRARMQKRVSQRPRRFGKFAWIWAPVAVALLAVIGSAIWERQRGAEQIYGEVADLHVTTLASSTPMDVVSADRHTVKPWFQGKIPFAFDLPELQGSEFSLLGGRITYLEQAPGAHLIYQVRKHEISVFIFREASLPGYLDTGTRASKETSFSVESWSQGGLRYFVMGDASPADIENLANLFRGSKG